MKLSQKLQKRNRRHKRVRAKVKGTKERPRFSVFRSRRHIYGQLVDDENGRTLVSASDLGFKKIKNQKPSLVEKTRKAKIDLAFRVGRLIAKKALDKQIKKVVFDRGGYKYHGRAKAAAEGARGEGLEF